MKKIKNSEKVENNSGLVGANYFTKEDGLKEPSGHFSGSLVVHNLPGYFLLTCLIVSLIFLIYVLYPFLTPVFVAAVLTVAFYPWYEKLLKLYRGRERLASITTCLLVILLIVIPLLFFALMIAGEAIDTYGSIKTKLDSGVFDKYLLWSEGGVFYDLKQKIFVQIAPFVNLDEIDLKQNMINVAQSFSDYLFKLGKDIVSGFSSIALSIFILIFSMFYFFKDGKTIIGKIGYISPLPVNYEVELFAKSASMIKAIVFGVFLTAIFQGMVGGVGFAIAGISSPVFWGAAMAFLSLIPLVGCAIVWVPGVIVLLILGQYGSALFLLLWGTIVISTVDNIARTYLIGTKAKTYPLLTFIVILGGIWQMEMKGIIVGPLILMVLMSFLHIYEAEYSRVLKH